jgi:molybdenum cofactor cytidylyltransferase
LTQTSQTTESDPRIVGGVILAAGASTRMGTPKQAIQVQGMSMLRRTVTAAVNGGCSPVVVVTGAHAETSRCELNGLEVEEVFNPDWETGMGTSIRTGFGALERVAPNIIGAVILVCDQPAVTAEHVSRLIMARLETGAQVVASRYGGTYGVPAVFGRELFRELSLLQGASGAKQMIRMYDSEARFIDFPEGEIDLDTFEDVSRYCRGG